MSNVLPFHVRVRITETLVEGTSLKGTARIVHVNKDAVAKLAFTLGLGCMELHKKLVTDVRPAYLELDEIWTYCAVHEKRKLKTDPKTWGDAYTMFALDIDTKLVPAYVTGKRTLGTATRFMKDLRARVRGKPQISVDAWPDWIEAVRRAFGHTGCHLGTIVKEYARKKDIHDPARRYSPSRIKSIKKTKVYGHPEDEMISTAMAERVNMTSRMHSRRLTRLTNGYTKKQDRLIAAIGLHFMWYNFVRVHETTGKTPAVMAGLAKEAWTIAELTRAALEEMGEMNEPKSERTRYRRKTHNVVAVP